MSVFLPLMISGALLTEGDLNLLLMELAPHVKTGHKTELHFQFFDLEITRESRRFRTCWKLGHELYYDLKNCE